MLSRMGVSLEKLTLLSDKFSPVFFIVRYQLHVISDRDGSRCLKSTARQGRFLNSTRREGLFLNLTGDILVTCDRGLA